MIVRIELVRQIRPEHVVTNVTASKVMSGKIVKINYQWIVKIFGKMVHTNLECTKFIQKGIPYFRLGRSATWRRRAAIQKRVIGSVDFNRSWDEFKNPFGNPEEDYWIGNDPIQQLTKGNDSSLYVSMTLVNGSTLYELYDRFSVSDEAEKYRLFLGGPASGTLGDRMLLPNDKINNLNGMYFTTWDRDNDRHPGHCVFRHGGSGWWYNHCHDACLNGPWDSEIWEQPWDPPIAYGTEVRGTLMMVRRD
ncbi:fibroleukin-like [Saccostrea cucullata]|uniref:fibroleukin-like n=1 Tax=Saccostrea cuccullata TaxID=36930 RepID=UPI002ECFE033